MAVGEEDQVRVPESHGTPDGQPQILRYGAEAGDLLIMEQVAPNFIAAELDSHAGIGAEGDGALGHGDSSFRGKTK